MPANRIVLWRHGQTAWNIENRFQGHTDIPLNAVGEFQVKHAAAILEGMNPSKIVSSDLGRAQQTAETLATLVGLAVLIDPRLRETGGGLWEGQTDEDNRQSHPAEFAAWLGGGDEPAGLTGERRTEVAARVTEAIHDGIQDASGTVVFVAHGGSIRCALGSILQLPLPLWAALGGLANASWSVLEKNHSGRWMLAEHNAGSIPEPVFGDEGEEQVDSASTKKGLWRSW